MTAPKATEVHPQYEDPLAGDWAGYHWAVEIPDGDSGRTRLVKYQTRERPARRSAEHGGFRLLCRYVHTHADGREEYGPWRDAALAGLVDQPTVDDRLYFVYRTESALPLLAGWRNEQAALKYAQDSNAAVVLGVDVVYRATPPFETGTSRRPREATDAHE